MRIPLWVLTLVLGFSASLHAEQAPEAPLSPPADESPVQLGGGVVLPRPVFEEIIAREDGLATIERMQQRSQDARSFEGVPHLIAIFVAVLLFFWSAMFYYQRKHARLHRTIQLMVEKGTPLPAELLRAAEQFENGNDSPAAASRTITPPWASNLMWGGLLWITIGVAGGLYMWLRANDAWPWAIAAVVYGTGAVITAHSKGRHAD